MAEEAMAEEVMAEEVMAQEAMAEEVMAEAMSTSAATEVTEATEGATRVRTGMAVIPGTTVIEDMAGMGPILDMSVIPAIMGTVDITAMATTTTVHGSRLARAS